MNIEQGGRPSEPEVTMSQQDDSQPEQEAEQQSPLDMPKVVITPGGENETARRKVVFQYDGLEGVTITKL